MFLELENMTQSFASITFDGVKQKGVELPPKPRYTSSSDTPGGSRRVKRRDSEYEPSFGTKDYFAKRVTTCCTEKTLKRKLPMLAWLPIYTMTEFLGDLIAGLTVGFTLIPQVIAFSELANLPAEYGLYSGFMGCFVYIIFGTVKEVTIVPAAVICILIGVATHELSTSFAIVYVSVICLLSGLFSMTMGFLKMGVIVEFVSAPVSAGFVSAAAIVIVVSQLKSILGLTGIGGEDLIQLASGLYSKLGQTNYEDVTMGSIAIVVLLLMREMKKIKFDCCMSPKHALMVSQVVSVISAARNVILIIICSVVAYIWDKHLARGKITLTKEVGSDGIPAPVFPTFYLPAQNETIHGDLVFMPERKFLDIVKAGGSAIFIIPLICIVEHIAVCKSFGKGRPVDVNQELIALGMSQFAAAFFHSMPVTGSISTSCVNAVSGARTPLGGIWAGIIVLLSLAFFTPYLAYIPTPALGAIVICAVIHFIEYEEALHIWKTKRRDMLPMMVTFICCLFIGLEWGFLVGVVSNLAMLLIVASNPSVPVLKFRVTDEMRVVILRPDRFLMYPGIERVRNLISKKALKHKDAVIVVDCVNLIDIDFTAAKGLGSVASALKQRNQKIVFVNVIYRVDRALQGFTSGDVETYETAQDWINTLSTEVPPNRRASLRILDRTLSHPDVSSSSFDKTEGNTSSNDEIAVIAISNGHGHHHTRRSWHLADSLREISVYQAGRRQRGPEDERNLVERGSSFMGRRGKSMTDLRV